MIFQGRYLGPLRAITGGIRARTHLAQVVVAGRPETAYVKAFEVGAERLLFNEVAGGWLAQRAGIGCPPGGLLWVPAEALAAVFPGVGFDAHEGSVPCYACAPVGNGYGLAALGLGDSVHQLVELTRQHLLAWPGFASCVAFDEWVANVDRHVNNLLLAAGGRLVPIDHSDCFGGIEGLHQDPDFAGPHAWYRNRLLEDLFAPDRLPLPLKAALVLAAEQCSQVHHQCDEGLRRLAPWLGEKRGLHWLEWLEARAGLTAELVRNRVRLLA
jgi:hypothetical protein